MNEKAIIGSRTAKGGFANEKEIVKKFNNWEFDIDSQAWLFVMGYNIDKIESVTAYQIPVKINKNDIIKYNVTECEYSEFIRFKKADAQIRIVIKIGNILKIENISLKKANVNSDFNQIDKRTVDSYQQMWGFDNEIAFWLKLFSGELLPSEYKRLFNNIILKETHRVFFYEMPDNIQQKIINFFSDNKILIISDIIKGRGGLSSTWMLVTRFNTEDSKTSWILKDINTVMNFYGYGDVKQSPRGSLNIGHVFLQRKGGTPDPTKLQFKFKPNQLFELENNENK